VVSGDDWQTALRIGRHLLSAGKSATADRPIQANLAETYRRIVEDGEGYCGDYADVFTALATAAGVFSRPWAFSFDGFGGRGHIFNEVWDRHSGNWRMVDVYQNHYVVDLTGEPLSAAAFRKALAENSTIRFVPIEVAARAHWPIPQKAFDYFRRGLPEWYQWWGNNVFEYDSHPAVQFFGAASRALEQLAGIAVGVHPRIRVLHSEENARQRQAMAGLARHLGILAFAFPASLLCAAVCACGWLIAMRQRREEPEQ
jgi:hypothetical protein